MAPQVDKNGDGRDDVTGEIIVEDYGDGQTGPTTLDTGVTSKGTEKVGKGSVTTVVPVPASEGAWAPKAASSGLAFGGSQYSTGALGQWAAGVSNPESAIYNELQAKSSLAGAVDRQTQYGGAGLFQLVADGRGHNSTANGVFQGYVAESAALAKRGVFMTPQALAFQEAQKNGWIENPPSDGGGSRSGAAAPTPADPSAIRRAMDEVSRNLIGRTLSDKEFNRYYKSYVSAFSGNNDMDPGQHMIERARKDEGYQEYQVATKFATALQNVLRGAA